MAVAHPTDLTKSYGLGTGPLSLRPNTDPAYFEAEREKVFGNAWIQVARVEDVAKPGDFIVRDLAVFNTSVIVVRGRDNKIRGFHNMCKHRGNKVVRTGIESGTCKGFSCGFHGWTYDLTGKLVIVPDEDQFFNVDKAKNGLTPIAVDVWEGFIFINNAPQQSLKEWLHPLYDEFQGYFENAHRVATYRAEVKVNWKVVLDAFVEAYHAPFLHGKAYPDQIAWKDNSLAHLLGCELFDRHRRLSIEMNPEPEPSPIAKTLLEKTDGVVFSNMARHKIDIDTQPPGVNFTNNPNWAFDIYVIFPMFYFGPTRSMHFATYNFWPVSVDRTIWQTDHYMQAPKNAGEKLALEFSKVFIRDVQTEDLITLENTQSMLRSGAMSEMTLSDQEVAVRHGYKVVEDLVNG